ncbi:MAG: GTP cyclohydrolase I FolE [Ignavibacteriae bacterium]|nr:GTP cyclohydrolase I FolE [Ignavibacteriota bacterium]MCB0725199.1 GTP cyclohydrolase I FolE [Ignavibacteriota bacterium]MCB9242477.1 GTP cyclohydrolase I FolE [Ignavibacteriales bacterium]
MEDVINNSLSEVYTDVLYQDNSIELSEDEKINKIEFHFEQIMRTLGLNLNDDSLSGTPKRVAKMFVKEMFSGLNPDNKPEITLFENKYGYENMLVEKDITLYSYCEHHFVPIIGKVHVAYIPGRKVMGLSKINRLVQYYAKRPQVQERLTMQISEALKEVVQHNDVAVIIDAEHLCVSSRGIKDTKSTTITSIYSGKFKNIIVRDEFLSYLNKR